MPDPPSAMATDDLEWARAARVSPTALARRAAAVGRARRRSGRSEPELLARAVRLLDLTTLAGDDTPDHVARLAAAAARPLRDGLWDRLHLEGPPPTVASVCVYPALVPAAVAALRGTGIPVAAVAGGFPAGQVPLGQKTDEVRRALEAGAGEIDAVISRAHVLAGDWAALYDEVAAIRAACGEAVLKTILATGDLGTYRQVAISARVCLLAGADFVKTSTGKERTNATLAVGLVLARAIRAHAYRSGRLAGLKPAGGLATAQDALDWLVLARADLGPGATEPTRLRLGASGLLADLERRLSRFAAG